MYVFVCVYVCLSVCPCMCLCIHKQIQRHTWTHGDSRGPCQSLPCVHRVLFELVTPITKLYLHTHEDILFIYFIYLYIISHLLSATYKLTSGPLHGKNIK